MLEISNFFDFIIYSFFSLGGMIVTIYKIFESKQIIFFLKKNKYRRKKLGQVTRLRLQKALGVNIIFIVIAIIVLFVNGHFINYFTQANIYFETSKVSKGSGVSF